jgi:hypothetical protein
MADVDLEEVVAATGDIVAEQAENVEDVMRYLRGMKIKFGALGYTIGAATGALIAFKVAYTKAETKFSQLADAEIEEMRQHYQDKVLAVEANRDKAHLEDLVQEKGYAPVPSEDQPLMAVTPPDELVDAAAEGPGPVMRTSPAAPVPADPAPPIVRNLFRDAEEKATRNVDVWDYEEEKRGRSPDIPYIIHADERYEFEGYGEETLTYYEKDDVLCNERDEVLAEGPERERLIGEWSLDKFGHGSNDPEIVYVRNDRVEMIYEIVKSPNSYAEEVHGFSHDSYSNIEKMRLREREGLDDDG